jgi:hypothetical protein
MGQIYHGTMNIVHFFVLQLIKNEDQNQLSLSAYRGYDTNKRGKVRGSKGVFIPKSHALCYLEPSPIFKFEIQRKNELRGVEETNSSI